MGFHAHFLIVDDPIDPQKVLSEIELASANSFFHETLPSRKVDQRISVTILVMQRLHQDDPTGNWLAHREETIKHICLPAEDSYPVKPPELKNYYVHGLLDPIRLSRFVLAEKESKGQFYYAGQYGQHPVPLGGGMFKTDCLVFDHPPDKFKRTIRYWDNASTKGAGAYSVGAKLAEDYNGRFWVLDIVRGRWATEVRERIKYQTAQIDGYGVIIGQEQEPGSGGKESAEATVKRLAGFRIRLNRPTGEKALRADPFSQQVNVGNVYLPIGKPWIRDYIEEMRFFPMSKYKDQIDASSGAFAELVRQRIVVGAVV
jgi:predicted phage terminase large subunit-like protein